MKKKKGKAKDLAKKLKADFASHNVEVFAEIRKLDLQNASSLARAPSIVVSNKT